MMQFYAVQFHKMRKRKMFIKTTALQQTSVWKNMTNEGKADQLKGKLELQHISFQPSK